MKKPLLFFIMMALMITVSSAQIDSTTIISAEEARMRKEFKLELDILLKADTTTPNSTEILWRIARAYAEKASRVKITASEEAVPHRKEFFSRSLAYAEKTKQTSPNSPQGYYYTAIATGGIIQYATYKEMIKGSSVIKENAEKAVLLDSGHHRAMHILGRWHFEVARLSSFVKFVANIFYDQIPKGSYEQAAINFNKAANVKDLDIHRLWLAKTYIKLNEKSKAKNQLKNIIDAPVRELNDSAHKSEAKKLLTSLKK